MTAGRLGWGVVGAGAIAAKVLPDLAAVPGAELVAVSASRPASAQAFAEQFGFDRACASLDELLQDERVDIVYVATPHVAHHLVARAALEAGKAVLVEKPFTASLSTTLDLVELARDRGLFAMEAMWTRFLPTSAALERLVSDGVLGEVVGVVASAGFVAEPGGRLHDPALGGGSLLDLGSYTAWLAQGLLGEPASVTVTGVVEGGVDVRAQVELGYPGGAAATLVTTLLASPPSPALVIGRTSAAWLGAPVWAPRWLDVDTGPERWTRVTTSDQSSYQPMFQHVQERVLAGATASDVVPLEGTVAVMRVLDAALDALGPERAAG